MKYWKGINVKNGHFGTMDDDGYVPDSVSTTKEEYDTWVLSLPISVHILTKLELLEFRIKALENKIK